VAIVTGAGAGLGRAIAGRLADAGAHVVVFEIDGASAEQAAQELGGEFRQVDVSDGAQVDQAVRSLDRVDILVNNAGVSHVGKELHEVTDHEWHRSIDVMQHGAFYLNEPAPDRQPVLNLLATCPSVEQVEPNGAVIRCRWLDRREALPALHRQIVEAGIPLISLSVKTDNLEDIYMKISKHQTA